MENTPNSMRKYIAIFGKTNSGKSSLFNAIINQDLSIVSDVSGTTTDAVSKAIELPGYGAITLVDTAGTEDESILGDKRYTKTKEILSRCDLALYVKDINEQNNTEIDFKNIPVIDVYTKCDIADKALIESTKMDFPDAVFVFGYSEETLSLLLFKMAEELKKQQRDDESMLAGLLNKGDTVLMVIPIDSAAPKGRLILPQVQALRDCLDNGIRAISVTPDLLEETLCDFKDIKLVITDSQVFDFVASRVPVEIPLTSFSILLANQKGGIKQLIEGTKAISLLEDGDNILMLEACAHSATHEDIGKVKIPTLLKRVTGKELVFTHMSGYDFPENIEKYKLVIQCGGCMINKKTIENRLKEFEEKNIPVTNYGVVLAYLNKILDRASNIFLK